MGKDAGARRAMDRHLQAMSQQVTMAPRLAILAVIVDRMVVATGELEGGEHRFGLGARVDVELLPDLHVLEPVRRSEAVLLGLELTGFRHAPSPRCRGTIALPPRRRTPIR